MNIKIQQAILGLTFGMIMIPSAPVIAATYTEGQAQAAGGDSLSDIKTYLANLGLYIGYDLTLQQPPTPPSAAQNTLLNQPTNTTAPVLALAQNSFFGGFGAMPVNAAMTQGGSTIDTSYANFVSTAQTTGNAGIYAPLNNGWPNASFPSYNTTGQPLSISTLIDQPTYQLDPVNQALLNIISTPDSTFCMSSDGSTWNSYPSSECPTMYQNMVMNNAIGTLPGTGALFTAATPALLGQLNANSLIGPLLYSTTANNSPPPANGMVPGLTATNQIDNAENFIRYVSGMLQPMPMITRTNYDNLYVSAYPYGNTGTIPSTETASQRTARESALATLDNYIASVRSYAAKSSVGISNLYYILSKRLPQKGQTDTSQALNELQMATRRQYDPTQNATQWIDEINTASAATVQKEMALLLSDINYQLYLNRQQEERILLTNTLLLLGSTITSQPQPPTS